MEVSFDTIFHTANAFLEDYAIWPQNTFLYLWPAILYVKGKVNIFLLGHKNYFTFFRYSPTEQQGICQERVEESFRCLKLKKVDFISEFGTRLCNLLGKDWLYYSYIMTAFCAKSCETAGLMKIRMLLQKVVVQSHCDFFYRF